VSTINEKLKRIDVNAKSVESLVQGLQEQLCELAYDVEKLNDIVNSREISSFKPMCQRQCIEDSVDLARKTAAVNLLRNVLKCFSDCTTVNIVSS